MGTYFFLIHGVRFIYLSEIFSILKEHPKCYKTNKHFFPVSDKRPGISAPFLSEEFLAGLSQVPGIPGAYCLLIPRKKLNRKNRRF